MADHQTDYLRAVNALDLIDWLANQTTDAVTLKKYIERVRQTLELVEQRLSSQAPA